MSPWLVLVPLAAIPPLLADRVAKKITKQAEDDTAHDRRLAGLLFGLASDAGAAGEIRAYGLAPTLEARHAELTAAVDRRSARESVQVFGVQAIGWTIYALALMGAIAFVVVRAADHAISLGTVLMAVSLIRRSRTQLASAAASSGAFISTLATADRLFWLEDHAAAEAALTGVDPAPATLRDSIELHDVTFCYPGTDRPVLDRLSVRLPAGSTVALVGENGSGKTTLIKLLLGMYRPTSGVITVDGRPLDSIDPGVWRARSSAAFQDFARFHLAAVESIGVADLPTLGDEDAAVAALTRAGAADLPAQLPNGLATEIGTAYTGGHGLSGGQWQKLALGRAMRRDDPLLVVLDEPTASLDAQSEHALFERYAAAASTAGESGAITVLVSHRFSTVQMADLIVYIEAGAGRRGRWPHRADGDRRSLRRAVRPAGRGYRVPLLSRPGAEIAHECDRCRNVIFTSLRPITKYVLNMYIGR